MQFKDDAPIYQQIVDRFKLQIATGRLAPGAKVKSVRDYAVEMGVNPNTMQKAMSILEQDGLLHTERTAGRSVTEDAAAVDALRRRLIGDEVRRFLAAMAAMGYDAAQSAALLEDYVQTAGQERRNEREQYHLDS